MENITFFMLIKGFEPLLKEPQAKRCAFFGGLQRGGLPLVFIPPFDTNLKNKIMVTGQNAQGNIVTDRAWSQDNPFVGTPYADMWENNPYRDLYYQPTFWDNIGLSNKAKDANAEYQRLYNEYVAGIYDKQRQDEYNTPQAEAQRMRQAGINPDLQGLTGDSNSSGMSAPNAGNNPALNGQSPAFNGLHMIGSTLGFATSVLQQIGTLNTAIAQADGTKIDNFSKLLGLAREPILEELRKRFLGSGLNNWSDVSGVNAMQFPSKRLSSMYQKAFNYALNLSGHNDSLLYKNLTDFESNRWNYGEKVGYNGFSNNDQVLFGYIGKLVDADVRLRRAKVSAETKEQMIKNFRNDINSYLYNSFKNHGNLLSGLMLLGNGSISFPTMAAGFGGFVGDSADNLFKSFPKGSQMVSDYLKKFFESLENL